MLNFNWLAEVPMTWARFIVLLAFVAPLVFALTLKRDYILQGASDRRAWRNLKWWAFFLVAVQIAIYLYF